MSPSDANEIGGEDESPIDPVAIGRLMRIGGPSLLRRIIDLYTGEAVTRLDATLDAVATRDAAGAEAAAHSLKSMAGNVGAHRVRSLCQTIEEGARLAIGAEVRAAADALSDAHRLACEELADLRPDGDG
ncbi:MAG: Hpt domain-containing protein [Myxococcota bacterium]